MVTRYGDEHDCGVWAKCDNELVEEFEKELEEYENRILRLAECMGNYRECDTDEIKGE